MMWMCQREVILTLLCWTATASAFVTPPAAAIGQVSFLDGQIDLGERGTRRHSTGRLSPLLVVADFADQEEMQKKKRRDDDHDADGTGDNAWTPTSGGFLPNLRGRIMGKMRKPEERKKEKVKRAPPSTLPQVVTLQEYKEAVGEERERMVCVRFYAPWCRSCKAVGPAFARLALKHPEIKFVEAPLTKTNTVLHKGLGVPSLPYAHLYHPEAGLVEERRINKKLFPRFAKILQTYVDGECTVSHEEE